jgi:hypothetical protein
VHLVEQRGDLLDLVDDDNLGLFGQRLLPQRAGANAEFRGEAGIEEVVVPRTWELLVQEGRLADLPGPRRNAAPDPVTGVLTQRIFNFRKNLSNRCDIY